MLFVKNILRLRYGFQRIFHFISLSQ